MATTVAIGEKMWTRNRAAAIATMVAANAVTAVVVARKGIAEMQSHPYWRR